MLYLSLFFSALISATLLPASSELLLSGLVVKQQGELFLLWLSATAGNVLGSVINYYLGTIISRVEDKRWFPVSKQAMSKAQHQFEKYGVYSLVFAWLPVVGDPLTLVAGVFRTRFSLFLLLVATGKGLRYAVVIGLAAGFM
ncbi:YqaA family protein [Pseudoalteromonas ardens]|uniref:Membrane protein n=1 Tax=Pseudoalteromonas rubra TaxID=43658 RepID=A0A0L0ET76_9GAMM|nr:YqaA family protein [Pseudoalteromonas sp. R96]KNC67611.1 membrane protein [Pseudoalteromonas rubra]MDK1314242.1 YqaA family protein [Pseudoalteromonas sp. R96]